MKRRSLLKLSAAALTAGPLAAGASSPSASVPTLILRTRIAGHHYHHGPQLLDELEPGQCLQLVREPANPHDADAVRLDWNGKSLGYLPRDQNYAAARLLDEGRTLAARICDLDFRNDPWRPVAVDISLEPGSGNSESKC